VLEDLGQLVGVLSAEVDLVACSTRLNRAAQVASVLSITSAKTTLMACAMVRLCSAQDGDSASDVGGDDAGGVPVEGDPGPVVAHCGLSTPSPGLALGRRRMPENGVMKGISAGQSGWTHLAWTTWLPRHSRPPRSLQVQRTPPGTVAPRLRPCDHRAGDRLLLLGRMPVGT
jgi:hypothetical protein